jgi:CheY-like chemotaxis protein
MSLSTTTSTAFKSRPVRVLLVEDHAALAEATAQFLRDAGLEVQIADSGKKALETGSVFRPEIVLCDIRLPDMSGMDVVRFLRANPQTSTTIIAMHTSISDADLQMLENNNDQGISLFVSKPITEQNLKKLLALLGPARHE